MSHLGDPFGFDNQRTVTRVVEKVVHVSPDLDGHDIHYWHEMTRLLKKDIEGVVKQRDEAVRVAIEAQGIDVGLRAVIRFAMAEIRKVNPNHPLLEKKNRDRIFHEFEKQEIEKVLKTRNQKPWSPLELSEKAHTSE